MSDLAEKIIGNGKLTASARIAILVFSTVGAIMAPLVWGALTDLNKTLSKIDTHLAVQDERTETQGRRIDALESANRVEDVTLQDHGGRLIRLETRAGISGQ